jgi:hypothetical protein
VSPGSRPSPRRAAVTPLAPPTGRQHLHHRDSSRSAAKAVSGGSFEDRSSAPLIGETSCSVWRCLQLGDVCRVAVAPLQGGEHAFLHGLSRSPPWGGGGCARCGSCTRRPPSMGGGCMASSASPSVVFGYLFDDLVGGILAVGVSVLQVVRTVLVGTGDGCWSWWRAPCSSADGLFVVIVVSQWSPRKHRQVVVSGQGSYCSPMVVSVVRSWRCSSSCPPPWCHVVVVLFFFFELVVVS